MSARPAVSDPARPLGPAVASFLARRARWTPLEIVFWLAAASTIWLLPAKHLILTEICIWALFALSLDLILGYAGIISLGHAAFFGLGAYAAGLIGKYGLIGEPVLALLASGLVAAVLGFVTSFLVLRGSDLTRLMVTLGVAFMLREIANKYSEISGGADGLQGVEIKPIFGLFRFDLYGHNGYVYSLVVLFVLFVIARRVVRSPFGLSLQAIRGLRCAPPRSASPGQLAAGRDLHPVGRLCGHRGLRRCWRRRRPRRSRRWRCFRSSCSADVLLILIIGGTG